MEEINVQNIRSQIYAKTGSRPYIPSGMHELVITDHDSFPYNRFFRGQYTSDVPIVSDRQAGYRPLNNSCYGFNCAKTPSVDRRDLCWQGPCSVVYPCCLPYEEKYRDRKLLNVLLQD